MRAFRVTMQLAVAAAVVGSVAVAWRAAGAAGSPVASGQNYYQVLDDGRRVGYMRLKVMEVEGLVILEEEFRALYKKREAGFKSSTVYEGGERPRPQRASVTTRVGDFKLMEGSVVFEASGGGEEEGDETLVAKVLARGYADVDRKPFEESKKVEREMPVPAGLVLTFPAFVHFAPRLLPKEGRLGDVVFAEIPDDLDYPAMANFKAECLLDRGPKDEEGRSEVSLKRRFAGGNLRTLATMTIGGDGGVTEARFGKFTLRPSSVSEALEPLEAE